MIKTVKIDSMDKVKDLLFEQKRNDINGRLRSSFFYRGMPDEKFDLSTSLARNCGKKAAILENHLLENYIKYVSIEDPSIEESIWKAMIIGQHHGLPTRLLDWTHSTLVALHFATTEGNLADLGERDAVVWRIDARELNQLLPQRYQDALNSKNTFIFSVKHLSEVVSDIGEYDKEMGDKSLVTVEPPSIDQRIVNQYSFFTVLPSGITDLAMFLNEHTENTIKYVIDKSLRWDIRDILDQLNMNERMIYPGKDGIAKWLARHYFVRDKS
ncbi:FRG domain-containing protein [Ruminococcus flavefaciens]|uniref:FRG domain-containing protein n=1 Tax=Ruminococcus flavefaciens TaxID=1265 RepID=UPI0026F0F17B|nr:FRG domain-containing protein [Ruminococcus flavefaciens]MDD7517651.1 FRG domain-containing protein [Ruminococcus flavefaciens]MDY5692397.1 FRG domain-containing protein [Ruminococcus flavefaciens]